jgi:hypothetical protein
MIGLLCRIDGKTSRAAVLFDDGKQPQKHVSTGIEMNITPRERRDLS